MNLYCVFGSVGLITPRHIASEPIVFHANPLRCNAAKTRVVRRLLSRITPLPPFWFPLRGYSAPMNQRTKKLLEWFSCRRRNSIGSAGCCGDWICYCRSLWVSKKASSSLFQVGSTSERYMMSRSMYPSALQLSFMNISSIISRGNA